MRNRRLILFCGVAILGGAGIVAPAPVMAVTKEQLRQVESQIDAQRQRQQKLDQQTQEANDNLVELRQRLIAATDTIQDKNAERTDLQNRLNELAKAIADKKTALGEERHKMTLVISALMEFSRQPPEAVFLRSDISEDHIHRSIILRAVLPRIKEQAEAMARDLLSLADLKMQMGKQKTLVSAAEITMRDQQRQLDQMIHLRQGLLQKNEAEKETVAKQLSALSAQAQDLRQLLEKIGPKQGGGKKQGAPLNAVLRPPVSGNLVSTYGARDEDDVVSQGLTYAALSGSPVVAPTAGKVVFAGPFRGYGQIVILQHSGGYHSFLSGFGRIDADVGQEVEAGEPLGVMPSKAAGPSQLYFELRYNNEPINPASAGISFARKGAQALPTAAQKR